MTTTITTLPSSLLHRPRAQSLALWLLELVLALVLWSLGDQLNLLHARAAIGWFTGADVASPGRATVR